jgi:hypothetical protein
MTHDRAARVAVTIIDLIFAVRGDEFRRRVEDLLRQEFADERQQGVADRGDDDL